MASTAARASKGFPFTTVTLIARRLPSKHRRRHRRHKQRGIDEDNPASWCLLQFILEDFFKGL
jgi:hypothetical protein